MSCLEYKRLYILKVDAMTAEDRALEVPAKPVAEKKLLRLREAARNAVTRAELSLKRHAASCGECQRDAG